MKKIITAAVTAIIVIISSMTVMAAAITQTKIQTGKTGQNMTLSFQYTVAAWEEDLNNVYYGGIYCGDIYDIDELDGEGISGIFPFERPSTKNAVMKIGPLKAGTHTVNITMRVRRDIKAGYYKVPVFVSTDENNTGTDWIKIYIQEGTGGSEPDPDTPKDTVTFELGEGQLTPYGVYPAVMDFNLHLRNSGSVGAQDVKASIVCNKSSTDFPFEINETNYDRHFDVIPSGQSVELYYSFAIRSDTYSGYYPIPVKVTYRETSTGELKEKELQFFVHIVNREKEEETRDFNPNDRVKARIVVDSFHTEPGEVYAGQAFDLVITMKNASSGVAASNILFTFDSEKANDSPVFSTQSGSNSVVVNSLKGDETTEIRMSFNAKAGVDPRSYSITIGEKYDSPEFKNAEEKVMIDIPVKEVSKFNLGNIELLPESISVGEEINVMFPINNTGKTMLYNCIVRFAADSVNDSEIYLGNIKPGESGNVDAMLKGRAATEDEGDVKVIISYEDEYGTVTETEKNIKFYVYEEPEIEIPEFIPDYIPEAPAPWYRTPWFYAGGGILLLVIIIIIVSKAVRKKKEIKEESDEIS